MNLDQWVAAWAPTKDAEWQDEALCAQTDPEAFFPEKGSSTKSAKQVCLACPVTAECLAYALATKEQFGIWGGLSTKDRRKLLPPEPPRCKMPDETIAALKEAIKTGKSDQDIMARLGVSRRTIERYRWRMRAAENKKGAAA